MQALLNIDEYFVEEVRVRTNPDYVESGREQRAGQIKVALSIKKKGAEPEFMISMKLEVNKAKRAFEVSPYHVFLDIAGYFSFQEGTDQDTMDKMIGFNGPAVLYGVARGIVSQMTANCRHGKFVLPTVNFVELLKKQSDEKRQKKKPARKRSQARRVATSE
jgi:preprotein translocase subunit SecB